MKKNKRQREVLAACRKKRTEKGWVYFSCQVPPEIKNKLQKLLKTLRNKHKI